MKVYWHQLNERERWMLGLGAGCLLLYVVYFFIYAPLDNSITQKSRLLSEKKETLLWMQNVRGKKINAPTLQTLNNAQLLSLLAGELKKPDFQAFPYQLHQVGTGDIQLTFEQIPFKVFMNWLWSFNKKYAFTLKQFQADRTETSGIAKITVTFTEKNTS